MSDPNLSIKNELVERLKEILCLSISRCDDGNPNEEVFVSINTKAYECLKCCEKLGIKKPI